MNKSYTAWCDQRTEFFETLYQNIPDDGKSSINVRCKPASSKYYENFWLNNPSKINDLVLNAERMEDHTTYYFGVSTVELGKAGKSAIQYIPCLWTDIDFKETDKVEAGKKLADFKLQPTIIVHSGNGLHCYWVLDKPFKQNKIDVVENLNNSVLHYFCGDRAARDASRVLRVPYTINYKYDHIPMVQVLLMKPENVYKPSDFDILPKVKIISKNDWAKDGFIDQAFSKKYKPQDRNDIVVDIIKYYANHLPAEDVMFHVMRFVKDCVITDDANYNSDDIEKRVKWAIGKWQQKKRTILQESKDGTAYLVEIWMPKDMFKGA